MTPRLLLVALLALVPTAPAHAGPAACVRTVGFPVCAGNCQTGDPVTVIAIDETNIIPAGGSARCGGVYATGCANFLAVCTATGTAPASGSLTCEGGATVVICLVGTNVANAG